MKFIILILIIAAVIAFILLRRKKEADEEEREQEEARERQEELRKYIQKKLRSRQNMIDSFLYMSKLSNDTVERRFALFCLELLNMHPEIYTYEELMAVIDNIDTKNLFNKEN